MNMKYSIASCRMTFQRLVIPEDLGGSSFLALITIIKRAVRSIT